MSSTAPASRRKSCGCWPAGIRPGSCLHLPYFYRTFICGEPNKQQIDAFETASKWISASIDLTRPGITPDQVAQVWPDAQEFGYRDEAEAFLLQYGHGVGLSLGEGPIHTKG